MNSNLNNNLNTIEAMRKLVSAGDMSVDTLIAYLATAFVSGEIKQGQVWAGLQFNKIDWTMGMVWDAVRKAGGSKKQIEEIESM